MSPPDRWRPLQICFLLLGMILLALWSRRDFESRRFQSAESSKLDAAVRTFASRPGLPVAERSLRSVAATPSDLGADSNRVLGRLEIPRLGILAIVAEGTDAHTLGRAVGHIPATALPGTPGNCALAGHRDTFLRGLGGVQVNDTIRIVASERTYTYAVEWSEIVDPRRVDLLEPTSFRSLTLVTCYPFVFIGRAPQRFVVRARQIDSPAGYSSGSVRTESLPGGGPVALSGRR